MKPALLILLALAASAAAEDFPLVATSRMGRLPEIARAAKREHAADSCLVLLEWTWKPILANSSGERGDENWDHLELFAFTFSSASRPEALYRAVVEDKEEVNVIARRRQSSSLSPRIPGDPSACVTGGNVDLRAALKAARTGGLRFNSRSLVFAELRPLAAGYARSPRCRIKGAGGADVPCAGRTRSRLRKLEGREVWIVSSDGANVVLDAATGKPLAGL